MDDLYERALDRVEEACGRVAVQGTLSILWGARSGMEEGNITAISGLNGDTVARVLSSLENHLVRHDGRMMILRDELRAAVERRYLGSGARQQALRVTIAGFFAAGELDGRRLDEEPWQWLHADQPGRLCDCLVNIPMTMALILGERRDELFFFWRAIEGSCSLVAEYERVLAEHEQGDAGGGERAEIFHALSDFYAESFRYDLAKSLLERCLVAGERGGAASRLDDVLRQSGYGSEILPASRHARSTGARPSPVHETF
jgi:hypothetical protein